MWDHFVLHCDCLPHQYLCGTTLYCTVTVYLINTYVGLLCIASVPMWDHFVLHCLPHQYPCGTTLHCISTYVGPLCIATVGICLISRPTYMWDHFVLHCDCLPHQYLCGTTLYCTSTYVGPLCIALFTSSVPMWDHIVLYQYLCGTTLYCTVYFTSTYVDHFVYQYLCGTTLYCNFYLIRTYVGPLCIATVGICLISRPTYMWDHFVLYCDCLPHQYLCVTTLYCTVYLISTYLDHFV